MSEKYFTAVVILVFVFIVPVILIFFLDKRTNIRTKVKTSKIPMYLSQSLKKKFKLKRLKK